MLLFSAQLEISNAMTKEAFVRLAIEWNQGSPHVENRIQGINWNGVYNVRYGTENLWLAIEEYRNKIPLQSDTRKLKVMVWSGIPIMS